MTVEDFLARFEPVERHSKYSAVVCPCHDDNSPSLHVTERNGKILLKCRIGCENKDIVQKLGLTLADLFVDAPVGYGARPSRPNEVAYAYRDANGAEIFKKFRYVKSDGKKTFVQRARMEDGSYAPGLAHLNGQSKVLYRLPEVRKAVAAGKTIYLNEGEKAVDQFFERGEVATCQPDGADLRGDKWLPKYTEWLKGAKLVVIVADRDDVGLAYARYVAAKLKSAGIPVRVVQSKTEKEHDDAFDHFLAGYGVDDFVSAPKEGGLIKRRSAASLEAKSVDWLWKTYIPRGMITIVEGDPDQGKSFVTCALSSAVSNGNPLPPNGQNPPVGRVLIFATEDDPERTIVPRLNSFGADMSMIDIVDHSIAFDRAGLAALEEEIIDTGAVLVILDPLLSFVQRGMKASRDLDERFIMDELKAIANRTNCALVGIRHLRKASGQDTNLLYQGFGAIDILAAARSVLTIKQHPEKHWLKIVSHIKCNIAEKGPAFGYEIRKIEEDRFELFWHNTVDTDAAAIIAKPNRSGPADDATALQEAKEFLLMMLADGKYAISDDLLKEAKSQGLAPRTIWRAKKELNVKATNRGFSDSKWRWYLPADEVSTDAEEYDPYADE